MKEKIRTLLKEKNAILLAHNYQPPEIQEVADLCGDSLELSIRASKTGADIILFCGVSFMAETAAILSPSKTVLLPRPDAGCPMADMATPAAITGRIKELGGPMPVVTYVNSTAAVKAVTTVCCTSANVVQVVNSLETNELLMVPDRNLAQYAAAQTGKRIHLWEGCCPFHDALAPEDVLAARKGHPEALFVAHPECRPEVVSMADAVRSTSGMMRYAAESSAASFIIGTETGLLHPLRQHCPDKAFFPASTKMICPDMKKISLADIVESLEKGTGRVTVPEEIRIPALAAVERMIAVTG